MSSIKLAPNASGTGEFTIAAPNSNTNRTFNLPDSSGTIATAESTLSQFNASGSAPVYACRAWVNFNGTGTVAIRASGNVSSITDNGAGKYTVNFSSAMPDTNYSAVCLNGNGAGYWGYSANIASPVAGSCGFEIATPTGTANTNPAYFDPTTVCVAVFR